ncbi:MAG: NAD(P)H-hydrate epimerase [Oligoflexales bacterium]|nr:NAD(P)H-hydrate epimerase [Oligoflexales bacterium]
MKIVRKKSKPLKVSSLWSRAIASAVDKITIEKYKIDGQVLMELAGKAIADQLIEDLHLNSSRKSRKTPLILVIAGCGNNGGDALVAARWLIHYGFECKIYFVRENSSTKISSDCQRQLERLDSQNVTIFPYKEGAFDGLENNPDFIIDGLFGIGFQGSLKPFHEKCLKSAAKFEAQVYAVDIPSGMNCDLGSEITLPLIADKTITFGEYKYSQILMPSANLCGEVVVKDIGFTKLAEQEALNSESQTFGIVDREAILKKNYWNELNPNSHKFDRGHILVIGGSTGKYGAPVLAGLAALRCGAGWVSLALSKNPAALVKDLYPLPPEITFESFYEQEIIDGKVLLNFLIQRKVKSIIIGPGIVDFAWQKQTSLTFALAEYVELHKGCLLFDAGALRDVDTLPQWSEQDRILYTPHPGEWVKLAATSLKEPLEKEALAAAKQWCTYKSCTLIYKSARPVVIGKSDLFDQNANSEISPVLPWGSKSLARAGSGDVFAGIAAAHLAIGYDACFSAIRSYAVLSAACKILEEKNPHGILASDLINNIANAQQISSNHSDI